MSEDLHLRVREARALTGLSQQKLAADLDVSRGAVGQWEMPGGTAPSVENLIKLAQRSGMTFEYLATGRGPKIFGKPEVREPRARYEADPVLLSIMERVAQLSKRQQQALLQLMDSPLIGRPK